MTQIPIEQLIWAVKNKQCLEPYEKEAILVILREKITTSSNIILSDTE